MFGGDLPSLDSFTRTLLTNAEILSVNQHSTENEVVYKEGDIRVWTAKADTGSDRYIAVFNLSDSASTVHLSWAQIGITAVPTSTRELWTQSSETMPAALEVKLAPHASAIYSVVVH
jgi:hypothetical protein